MMRCDLSNQRYEGWYFAFWVPFSICNEVHESVGVCTAIQGPFGAIKCPQGRSPLEEGR